MPEPVHVVCPHCDAVNRVPSVRLCEAPKCGRCHRLLFEGRPVILDDTARFSKQVEQSDIPILIDFWATWCAPCHAMAPVFEQAAKELEPDVRLGKVETDANQQLARRFGVSSIPTLLLVRRGRAIARTMGAMPLQQLIAWTREHAKDAMSA
jgi:thioredoxin 2